MSRTVWAWLRLLGGAAVLAVVVWRLGTGPILDGFRATSVAALVAAAGIALVTTVFSAWRWSIVARGLGVAVPLRTAVAAYYRSQFLNTALPGGVLGDVHRGVSHGSTVGDVGRGLRAVAWERIAGQVVQIVVALAVLSLLASPVRSSMPFVVPLVVVATVIAVLVARRLPRRGTSRGARVVRAARSDLHSGVLAHDAWPGIVIASFVVVAGHTAAFLIAVRTAGTDVSVARLLPIAMLVLLATSLPTNIGGWGPREGVAGWVFAAAGLGAHQGVAAATVFGVMVFVASLPGAAVLLVESLRRRPAGAPDQAAEQPMLVGAAAGSDRG